MQFNVGNKTDILLAVNFTEPHPYTPSRAWVAYPVLGTDMAIVTSSAPHIGDLVAAIALAWDADLTNYSWTGTWVQVECRKNCAGTPPDWLSSISATQQDVRGSLSKVFRLKWVCLGIGRPPKEKYIGRGLRRSLPICIESRNLYFFVVASSLPWQMLRASLYCSFPQGAIGRVSPPWLLVLASLNMSTPKCQTLDMLILRQSFAKPSTTWSWLLADPMYKTFQIHTQVQQALRF